MNNSENIIKANLMKGKFNERNNERNENKYNVIKYNNDKKMISIINEEIICESKMKIINIKSAM